MKIYRVQSSDGRGPWRPGFSVMWADKELAPGQCDLQTCFDEFGADVLSNWRPGLHSGCGTKTIKQLAHWFSKTERQRLAQLGCYVARMRVEHVCAESENQIVFMRKRPLNEAHVIVPWDAVERALIAESSP